MNNIKMNRYKSSLSLAIYSPLAFGLISIFLDCSIAKAGAPIDDSIGDVCASYKSDDSNKERSWGKTDVNDAEKYKFTQNPLKIGTPLGSNPSERSFSLGTCTAPSNPIKKAQNNFNEGVYKVRDYYCQKKEGVEDKFKQGMAPITSTGALSAQCKAVTDSLAASNGARTEMEGLKTFLDKEVGRNKKESGEDKTAVSKGIGDLESCLEANNKKDQDKLTTWDVPVPPATAPDPNKKITIAGVDYDKVGYEKYIKERMRDRLEYVRAMKGEHDKFWDTNSGPYEPKRKELNDETGALTRRINVMQDREKELLETANKMGCTVPEDLKKSIADAKKATDVSDPAAKPAVATAAPTAPPPVAATKTPQELEYDKAKRAINDPKGYGATYMKELETWARQPGNEAVMKQLPPNCFNSFYGTCSDYVSNLRASALSGVTSPNTYDYNTDLYKTYYNKGSVAGYIKVGPLPAGSYNYDVSAR